MAIVFYPPKVIPEPTTAQVETALGISAEGDAAKVLNEQGDFISAGGGETVTKTLLEYINEFDMTPPIDGFCFLSIDHNVYGNLAPILYSLLSCTVQNSDTVLIKQYDVANNIIDTKEIPLSSRVDLINDFADMSINTKYGKITKFTVEPKTSGNHLLTINDLQCPSLLAMKFGDGCFDGVSTLGGLFQGINLIKVELPAILNNITSLISFAPCAQYITLPTSMLLLNNINLSTHLTLKELSECTTFGNIQIDANPALMNSYLLTSYKQLFKASRLFIRGDTLGRNTAIKSIDINWAGSLFTATSPQVYITENMLDATELNRIFTALPTLVGKTINVKGNPGAATCDPTIATAKGWTVTTA